MPVIECLQCSKNKKHQAKGMCATCYSSSYRKSNPNLDAKNWQNLKLDPRKPMLKGARKRAQDRVRPFAIALDDIVIPELCPVLGIKLQIATGRHSADECSPSLDEVEVGKGYVPGNVLVISRKANTMKSNATPEELLKFADWIYETFSKAISSTDS